MFLYHPPYIASALISLDLFLLYVKEPPKDILQWGFGPRNQVVGICVEANSQRES